MSGRQQLVKLKKIVEFYEQELIVIQARFREQNAIVSTLKNQYKRLGEELELAHQRNQQMTPTATNHLQAVASIASLRIKLDHVDRKLTESTDVLESRRIEMQQQLSKIESLERLITRKSESIAYQQRQREQQLADERYLNTQFSGKTK